MKHETIFIVMVLCIIYEVALSHYKMDPFITCLEQNDERPYGFKESLTWGNPESIECQENPHLCEIYKNESLPFAGQGDVCDHTDPITGNRRNACKLTVMFGEEIDDEKTWSWKCADLALSPVKDKNGNGTVGCLLSPKRIQCMCQEDYCTAEEMYAQYAAWGRPDHYPANFTAILEIDHGDLPLVVAIDGYYTNMNTTEADEDTDEDTIVDTIEDEDTIVDTNEDEDSSKDIDVEDVNQETLEDCLIEEAIGTECMCGVECESVEYEYRATVEDKCGDQILSTGEYGRETCDPFSTDEYEIGESYPCIVLSCENGEFRFTNAAYTVMVGVWRLLAVISCYYMILC